MKAMNHFITSNMLLLRTADWDSPAMCKALWSYKAQMPCDLTFAAGKNYTKLIVIGPFELICTMVW